LKAAWHAQPARLTMPQCVCARVKDGLCGSSLGRGLWNHLLRLPVCFIGEGGRIPRDFGPLSDPRFIRTETIMSDVEHIYKRSAMAVRSQLPRKKAPNPIDKHVGSRVRMRRLMLAMSQEKLGDALGLTFQQVQKYEQGTNRISASRLQQISDVLQVSVAFFFAGALNASAPHGGSALSMAQIDDFVSDSEGLRLIRAFMRIDNVSLRRRIVMLVQEIAGDDD
jgi:transcriptional regulator with XRE-family HTH domain